MTPKEKVKELINKMYDTEHCGIEHFPNKRYCECSEINPYQAKQCALIAVDEVLKSIIWHHDFSNQTRNYWQEVKYEIEKL